jgi:hypothetical protein
MATLQRGKGLRAAYPDSVGPPITPKMTKRPSFHKQYLGREGTKLARKGAAFVDATDIPIAIEHAVVDRVLVHAVAKAGGAHGECHRSPRPKSHRRNVSAFQVFDLNHAVRILALEEPRGFHRVVLSVAVSPRRTVYSNLTCHCG